MGAKSLSNCYNAQNGPNRFGVVGARNLGNTDFGQFEY
jgi:hypothetical protein